MDNDDPSKRLISKQESYDPDLYAKGGRKEASTLKITPSGKIGGKLSLNIGTAVGLRIANLYPATVEAYGAIEYEIEASTQASIDLNGNTDAQYCLKHSLTPLVGIYLGVGFSFKSDMKLQAGWLSTSNTVDVNAGYYHDFKYKFDPLLESDSCGD
jgi:hypothetical protein